MSENELKQQLRSGRFLPVYFFCGEEVFLSQHYANTIAQSIVSKELSDFNLFRCNGQEETTESILESCESCPLMSERKCVIVCDMDPEALCADDLKKLKSYLSDPAPYTTLVFWYDSVPIGGKKTAKQKSIFELAKKNGAAVEFSKKDGASLCRILCTAAKARGKLLSATTARRLIELSGENLQILQSEVEKLCAFSKQEEISISDVEEVASRTLDASVFDISKAILHQNAPQAFQVLDELFQQRAEPVLIFGVLCSAWVDLYRAAVFIHAGKPAESVAQYYAYRGKEFRLRNAARDAQFLTSAQLERGLFLLDRTDESLKSSALDTRAALEQAVAELILTVSGGKR